MLLDSAGTDRRPLGRSGLRVPVVGIGCSDFGDRARRIDPAEPKRAIDAAMTAGLRYFDTAPYYGFGLSERRVGDALRDYPRDSFILSSKVGRRLVPDPDADVSGPRNNFHSTMPFSVQFDYSYDGIMRSYEASLHRLGLARIDILLVHDIGTFAHGDGHVAHFAELRSGFRALEQLREAGSIGAFGIGVNESAVCNEVLDVASPDCFLLAGRYTLLEQESAIGLFDRCARQGVGIIAGGPYNTGLLAGGTRRSGAMRYDYGHASEEIMVRLQAIEDICDAHRVPIAAAALQFPLAHPAVASVLPGVGSAERVAQTREYLDLAIPPNFWADLRSSDLINRNAPFPGGA